MTSRTLSPLDRQATVFALGLMLTSYLLFSLRTMLDPIDPGDLVSLKRLLATGAGAITFWVVVTRSRAMALRSIRLGDVALLSLAALGPVLATRVGYDILVSSEDEASLARNLRWVLAWSGYFVAALLGYRVLVLQRCLAARKDPVQTVEAAPGQAMPAYEEADPLRSVIDRR